MYVRLLAVECEASFHRVSCRSFFDLHEGFLLGVGCGMGVLCCLFCVCFFSRAEKTRDFKLRLFYITTFNIKYVNIFSAKHLLI